VDEERLSRWAAGITAGFLAVLWPAIVAFSKVWDCPGDCKTQHGRAIVVAGVVALILAPVASLALILAGRVGRGGTLSILLVLVAGVLLLGSLAAWAGAAGALIEDSSGLVSVGNSFVLAIVMAVYCAAVAGGSWMSAVGLARLEGES
jgi:hypothetical protein